MSRRPASFSRSTVESADALSKTLIVRPRQPVRDEATRFSAPTTVLGVERDHADLAALALRRLTAHTVSRAV